MIDLVFQNFTAERGLNEKFFKKILETAVKELKFKEKNIGLSLNLVGESRIKELNKKYRGKNKITDVLSFPLDSQLKTESWKLKIAKSNMAIFDLGDIFICLPFAKKQAKRENIDIEKKLAQLLVHGLLHLAGYDHNKSHNDTEKMFKMESRILSKISSS